MAFDPPLPAQKSKVSSAEATLCWRSSLGRCPSPHLRASVAGFVNAASDRC